MLVATSTGSTGMTSSISSATSTGTTSTGSTASTSSISSTTSTSTQVYRRFGLRIWTVASSACLVVLLHWSPLVTFFLSSVALFIRTCFVVLLRPFRSLSWACWTCRDGFLLCHCRRLGFS